MLRLLGQTIGFPTKLTVIWVVIYLDIYTKNIAKKGEQIEKCRKEKKLTFFFAKITNFFIAKIIKNFVSADILPFICTK